PEEGISTLEPVIEKDPRNTDARHMMAIGLRSIGKLNEAQEHFDFVEQVKENLADANELAQKITSGKDSIDTRLAIAEKFWTYGSEQEAMIWMRSAYQLDPLYLPTLEFMQRYYQVKVKDDPALQKQLDRFSNEVAKAKSHIQQESQSVIEPIPPVNNNTSDANSTESN
ncbi:MAG TPA: hypothetical protein DEP12_02080, partial [Planctomycetaceae bacterium]|nr:hypothetical protein [Planctomycetaceae bacterium]